MLVPGWMLQFAGGKKQFGERSWGYVSKIAAQNTAKWGGQNSAMISQTRSTPGKVKILGKGISTLEKFLIETDNSTLSYKNLLIRDFICVLLLEGYLTNGNELWKGLSKMSRILCLDYDNTLFDHGTNEIPESAMEAINRVRSDYKIVLATGRYFNDLRNRSMKEYIKPDAIIHANGSVIEVNGIILYESFLDMDLLQSVILFALEHDLCLGTFYRSNYYNTNPQKLKERWFLKGNNDDWIIRDARELIGKKVYSLFLDDTVEAAALIEKNFPALRAPIMSEETGGADVIPRNISKAAGIKTLLDYWNQTYKDVAAIGDSMNDYELIKFASIGIAMGNAVSRLKEIADYVTTPISEDGIKNAIMYLEKYR